MTTRPDPADYDNLADYADALRSLKSLTPSEYAAVLRVDIDRGEEHYAESYAQYRSEVAMFGDAGPGQASALAFIQSQLADARAKLARVERIAAKLEV